MRNAGASCRSAGAAALALCLSLAAAPAAAQQASAADIERLMALVTAQQAQLDAMRAEIAALKKAQTQAAPEAATPVVAAAADPAPKSSAAAGPTPVAPPAPAVVAAPSLTEDGLVILSLDNGVKVTLSGRINQAMNVADDGASTDFYFVDNDVSNTRFRLDAAAPLGETTLGALLEIGVSPNNSYDVSQDNEVSDDYVSVRRADLRARNDGWGQISFGRGSMAADDTAEHDLSLVAGPIMYSGVADIVGGLQFTDGENLTGVTVGDAFFNFDGERRNRVRYDTPMLHGLQGSTAFGSEGTWDVALTLGGDYGDWSGVEFGDVLALAAVSLSDPGDSGADLRYAGSMSFLHQPSGVGLSLSAGAEDREAGDTPYNLYGKLFYDAEIFPLGPTGFGLDYTYAENVAGDGDQGQSAGLAVVQKIDPFGIELYGQMRWFDVDRGAGPDFEDILVGTIGTRFKF